MTPLTNDPTVVVLVDNETGRLLGVATNVSPELKVVMPKTVGEFTKLAANKPFLKWEGTAPAPTSE